MRVERLFKGGDESLLTERADISTTGCSDGSDDEVAKRSDRNVRNIDPHDPHSSRGAQGSPLARAMITPIARQ